VLTDGELTEALELATGLARQAVTRIREQRPQRVSAKLGAADLVTEVDVAVERMVTQAVLQRFPDHRVEGEELGWSRGGSGVPTWHVDPIDGTTNYASGLPWCSFSLALADERGGVVGVVAEPYRGEIFTAVRGRGARRNGSVIRCAAADSLSGTVVVTEWNGHLPWPGMFEMISALSLRSCTVRVMGSSALSLASVAAGRAAGAVLGSYHDVDDLAGLLIATEAGASVRGRGGGGRPDSGGVLVAAPGVAAELALCWGGPVAR
jgi:myo-inositol-1(or 4)-monophosphatase